MEKFPSCWVITLDVKTKSRDFVRFRRLVIISPSKKYINIQVENTVHWNGTGSTGRYHWAFIASQLEVGLNCNTGLWLPPGSIGLAGGDNTNYWLFLKFLCSGTLCKWCKKSGQKFKKHVLFCFVFIWLLALLLNKSGTGVWKQVLY